MVYGNAPLATLYKAFESDGFTVKKWARASSGSLGLLAEHATAANYDTGQKKTCYYVEGTPYERGYLLGLLAEPAIADMAVNFVDNIVFDLLGVEFLNSFPLLQKLLVEFVHGLSMTTWLSQPRHVHDEADGLLDGCRKSNPQTPVTQARLSIMNVGFDVLCALAYTGRFPSEHLPLITPDDIRLKMMCNAFSVFGEQAGGGHFFGRDFMFSTGSVFQNNIAHIIHRPQNVQGQSESLYPFVSVTAPGIIGSFSAMNAAGVAGGLNMSPAANCDTDYIGFNSLLLLRECIMRGASAAEASGVIRNARRGVPWNYVLSDGTSDTACTVEAGATRQSADFFSYPDKQLLPYLPDAEFFASHHIVPVKDGAAVRWCNDLFSEPYLNYNNGLWRYYKENRDNGIRLYDDAFSPSGYINRAPDEKNCPSAFYFAPRRTGRNVLVTTNHFLQPQMRLCAMAPWCAGVAHGNINDIQWRYDELNHQINTVLLEQGSVSYSTAKQLIDFLAPYGKFPRYYERSPKSRDGKAVRIEGCVSLFDLKARSVESHYGYYADEWVKTTLPAYFRLE